MTARVEVHADVVCPWSHVGLANLERAIDGDLAGVRWRAFQLSPDVPVGGVDREAFFLPKFGTRERMDAAWQRAADAGEQAGVGFRFDLIATEPNTYAAHRVIKAAEPQGLDVILARRLMTAYFEEGRLLDDPTVLREAASLAGVAPAAVADALENPGPSAQVQADLDLGRVRGVSGSPWFFGTGGQALYGAQPVDALRALAA